MEFGWVECALDFWHILWELYDLFKCYLACLTGNLCNHYINRHKYNNILM